MERRSLVLSLFPGIGLLDRAFEQEGFCVVRGPDLLWGGDIREFHPPAGVFGGVIGGPPCKPFSPLANVARKRYGEECVEESLIPEFERAIDEAQPDWFLMENVRFAPEPAVLGYRVSSQLLNNRWLGEEQSRTRRFSFGTRDGRRLTVDVAPLEHPVFEYAVVATRAGGGAGLMNERTAEAETRVRRSIKRSLEEKCRLQGLPADFLKDAPFTSDGKHMVIGNGVPLPMGRAIARGVRRALQLEEV